MFEHQSFMTRLPRRRLYKSCECQLAASHREALPSKINKPLSPGFSLFICLCSPSAAASEVPGLKKRGKTEAAGRKGEVGCDARDSSVDASLSRVDPSRGVRGGRRSEFRPFDVDNNTTRVWSERNVCSREARFRRRRCERRPPMTRSNNRSAASRSGIRSSQICPFN